jgi:heterotetrameric sarcosine oxidase delta subunit
MGLELHCPNCGPRSYHEFWFGGELRPWDPDLTEDEDYRNTWLRANVAGPQPERWFHFAGCRRWLTVERDTRDNTLKPFDLQAHLASSPAQAGADSAESV